MLPTTANFPACNLASFQSAPVGYEFMFYRMHRKILPGYWATMEANGQGELTAHGVRTDAAMESEAKEYLARGES